ncbi:putative G2/M phase checkpoint control protein Sum2 [Phakopsora pachyrhizi]|uniref:G2/M phase checkpoint control protein Sum2 n=1 Tax=Phakopsora pachyrhizi TaxID=170000 RepID=I6UYQ5_PHAPC|nr:putative G2/M phase checkpoint control protein Sum2 [Phakopsora pachyrhizi]KAI8462140.1 putative G2/M phase checkpoint control protein Sum2 [Phakopsora pachyrhizi]CAH7688655.1 putative G2/M phase checkpoint control protein Sum2 [Phakopsora pachyrhizi]
MAQQYIGSRISLISKSDIRYRGVLHSIDPAASTVSLEQVRSMGTEGRKANPADELAPTDTLYEFIVFRAADVKDLSIEAPAEPKPEPGKPSVPDDPAIMSTTAPPRQAPAQNHFIPPHMMQPPQGMFNNSMPPLMYPSNSMNPQWNNQYLPMPPPGQPMMGFPPQAPQSSVGQGHPSAPLITTNVQAPLPKPAAVSASGTSTKLPQTGSINTGAQASPAEQRPQPLPSVSPSKQLSSTSGPGASASVSPASASNPGVPINPSKTPVSGNSNGSALMNGIFGAPTTMDMMSTLASRSSAPGSAGHANNKQSNPQNGTTTNLGPKAPHHTASAPANSIPNKKVSPQPGNLARNNKISDGNHSQAHSSQAHPNIRHPLPQAPANTKSHGKAQSNAPDSGRAPHHRGSQSSSFVVPLQDFDFASANAKFQKAALAPHKPNGTSANGTSEESKIGEADQLSAATENLTLKATKEDETKKEEDIFIPEAAPGSYYDKKKSFFDDISSEVKERSAIVQEGSRGGNTGASRGLGGRGGGRGRGGKMWDRNAERQKNLDTFGDVALNPNLGALGSGYNGYGRGGGHRILPGMGGHNGYRGGRGRGYSRGMGRGGGFGNMGIRAGGGANVMFANKPYQQ